MHLCALYRKTLEQNDSIYNENERTTFDSLWYYSLFVWYKISPVPQTARRIIPDLSDISRLARLTLILREINGRGCNFRELENIAIVNVKS